MYLSPVAESVLEWAREQRIKGTNWSEISRQCKISTARLRMRIDESFREERRADHYARQARREANSRLQPLPLPPLIDRDKLLERLRAGLGHVYAAT